MLGIRLSWLRTSLGAAVALLLVSGTAWAHGGGSGGGGGGHGGGGGGHAGGGHVGGVAHTGGFGQASGFGFGIGGAGHPNGLYSSGFSHGLGYNPGYGTGLYNSGFTYGLGYNPAFGRGYPYGFGYGQGLGYNYGLGYGFGLGYGSGGYGYGSAGNYGQSNVSNRINYPYNGAGYGLPYLGYNSDWYGGIPYSYYGYGSGQYYGYDAAYGGTPADYGMAAAQSQIPPPPKDDMAHLLVIVPDNAELWFNGTKTKRTGPQREFISPKLTAGKRYSYEIKAKWTEKGKPVEEVRTARVQANNWQVIDFTKAEPTAKDKK